MPAGRPKEDLSLLPEGWYNDILDLYKEGASDVEVKALIYEWRGSISNGLWDRWIDEEPQFSETIKTGRILSEALFTRMGRTNLKDNDFNYTGWYMQMKNRFGWKDRVDNTTLDKEMNTTISISPINWVDDSDQ